METIYGALPQVIYLRPVHDEMEDEISDGEGGFKIMTSHKGDKGCSNL